MTAMTEKEMIEGCVKGKREIQQKLFEKYYGKLMGAAVVRCKDPHEAKDLVQETFIKAFKKIDKFDGKGSLEGWLKRILINNFIDVCRKKQYLKETLTPFNSLGELDVNNALEIQETESYTTINNYQEPEEFEFEVEKLKTEQIIELIHRLPDSRRVAFTLFVLDGLTHKEIAEYLGISENTSKTNYMRARVQLMEMVKENIKDYEECI